MDTPLGEIHIKILNGPTITISHSVEMTVDNLKSMIQDQVGISPDQQRLIYNGRQLEDSMTLAECRVVNVSGTEICVIYKC